MSNWFGETPSSFIFHDPFNPGVEQKKFPCKGCGEEFYESEMRVFNLRVGNQLHQQPVCDPCSEILMKEVSEAGVVTYDQDDTTVKCISCGVEEPIPTYPMIPHQCEECTLQDQGPPRYRIKPKSRSKYHK